MLLLDHFLAKASRVSARSLVINQRIAEWFESVLLPGIECSRIEVVL